MNFNDREDRVRDSYDDSYSMDDGNSKLQDKASAIKLMVRSFELRLAGYKWDAKGDKFTYTGDVLAGEEVISKATGLLQPFCEEANLITIKEFKTFSRQKWEINSTFNATLLAEMGSLAKNYTVVLKMFKSVLQNIGDIILGSKDVLKPSFGVRDEIREIRSDL